MESISIELRYLLYTALFMLLLWIPYILAHMARVGPVAALSYADGDAEMPLWARRLKHAHYNLVENFAPFAVVVIAGEILNVHTALTATCAIVFFWARVAHPLAQVSRVWGTRSAAFGIGWIATLIYLFAVLTAAL